MMLGSLQRFLVVGGLAIGLVACGAAARAPSGNQENLAQGPLGPPPPKGTANPTDNTPPPELKTTKVTDEGGTSTATEEDAKEEAVMGGLEDELVLAAGPAKPVTPADGAVAAPPPPPPPPPPRITVGANPKGVRGGPNLADPLTSGGGTVQAATEVRGSIDKEEIRRVVRAHVNDVKRCYEQGMTRRPDLEGRVVLKFTIGKAGTVVAATIQETTLNDRHVEQCIAGAAMKWTFPKPSGDGIVTISYPFILKAGS